MLLLLEDEERNKLDSKEKPRLLNNRDGEKKADDFNLTLQESDVFVDLIMESIKKFEQHLPKQLWKKGQKEEKKLMKFGAKDPSLEPD